MLRAGLDTGLWGFLRQSFGFALQRIKAPVFAGAPDLTSKACGVYLAASALTDSPSLSFAPVSRTSLACVSFHSAAAPAI